MGSSSRRDRFHLLRPIGNGADHRTHGRGDSVAALAPFQASQRAVVIDPLKTVSVPAGRSRPPGGDRRRRPRGTANAGRIDGPSLSIPAAGGLYPVRIAILRPTERQEDPSVDGRAPGFGGDDRCQSSARSVSGASGEPRLARARRRSRGGAWIPRWLARNRPIPTNLGASCAPTNRE